MLTQSEKMTTAREATFRIENPNSRPRASLILALDKDAGLVVGDLIGMEWNGASFAYVTSDSRPGSVSIGSLDGQISELGDVLKQVDVVMMVATHDTDPALVRAVGEACFENRTMTSGFVLDDSGDGDQLQSTLSVVRPYVISLVVGSDEEFLIEVLRAIRA